jgi:hypothetical protein
VRGRLILVLTLVAAVAGTSPGVARPDPGDGDAAEVARRFWESHGYLVPDPVAYERLKARATARAGIAAPDVPSYTGPLPVADPSFPGQVELDVVPPDPTGAIGPNSYIEMINLRIAIYDRSGGLIAEAPIEGLVGGNHFHYTDPQVLWDPHTQRFYYLIWDHTSATFRWGYSKDADPRTLDEASFCSYISGFGYSPFDGPDYPKLGQTKDFLLIGVNFFKDFAEFEGTDLLWIRKPRGGARTVGECPEGSPETGRFPSLLNEDGTLAFTAEPAQQADPSRRGWVVAIPLGVDGSGDYLTVWSVTTDRRTRLPVLGEPHTVPVPRYDLPAYADQCDQGKFLLDTLDGRLEHAVSAFNPATGAISIWTAHAVFGGAGSEVRWYEITPTPRDEPTLAQSGVASSPSLFAWNGAIASDRTVTPLGAAHGDSMVMGFNTSSASQCPAVVMVSKIGSGPQSPFVTVESSPDPLFDFSCVPICRWGDYGGASPDPAAPLGDARGAVWLASEIVLDGGGAGTWIWRALP